MAGIEDKVCVVTGATSGIGLKRSTRFSHQAPAAGEVEMKLRMLDHPRLHRRMHRHADADRHEDDVERE